MSLTRSASVYAGLTEGTFNKIIDHVRRQRPSLFNYGTDFFISDPGKMCQPVEFSRDVTSRGNPLISRVDPLPVPATQNRVALQWCAQLIDLNLDFFPGNQFTLPPGLPALRENQIALQVRFAAGVGCPGGDSLDRLIETTGQREPNGRTTILPVGDRHCFLISLYGIISPDFASTSAGRFLNLRLGGLEIDDISPIGLENSLECLLVTALKLGVLPSLRIGLDDLVFDLGTYARVTLIPTPLSPDIPANPAVRDDRLDVYFTAHA